jgi:hypothetical protein
MTAKQRPAWVVMAALLLCCALLKADTLSVAIDTRLHCRTDPR